MADRIVRSSKNHIMHSSTTHIVRSSKNHISERQKMTTTTAARVLAFWFGELNDAGFAASEFIQRWFKKDAAFDDAIRAEFGDAHTAAINGELDGWQKQPKSALARVILIDQFSRNMFRDDPRTWAYDEIALAASRDMIARGFDKRLRTHERVFVYMPLMHAEDLGAQQSCVAQFEALVAELEGDAAKAIGNNVTYAIRHMEIVERFGRFPHRNGVLARASTAEEVAFLQEPGSSF